MANNVTRNGGLEIKLGIKAPGDSVYTDLGNLADDCGFSSFETAIVATEGLSDIYAKKAPGRIDPGTFTGTLYFVPQAPDVLKVMDAHGDRAICSWQVKLNDGNATTNPSTAVFDGFLSSVAPGGFAGTESPKMSFTITITGPVVFTAGTAIS